MGYTTSIQLPLSHDNRYSQVQAYSRLCPSGEILVPVDVTHVGSLGLSVPAAGDQVPLLVVHSHDEIDQPALQDRDRNVITVQVCSLQEID